MSAPKQIHVLFHRDHDGVASAYPLWFIFGDAAEYHSVQYDEPFPILPDDSRVFIVDFSWPEKGGMTDALIQFVSHHREVVIIDHHTGPAEESLREVADYWDSLTAEDSLPRPRFTYVFDKSQAGAELAWKFAQTYSPAAPQGPLPHALQLIADRDLWRHKNDPSYGEDKARECERLHQGLFVRKDIGGGEWGGRVFFEHLHHICTRDEAYESIMQDGAVALATANAAIRAICKNAYLAPVYVATPTGKDILRVPTVESSVWQSEIAHELLARNPDAPCAIVRYTKPAIVRYTKPAIVRYTKPADDELSLITVHSVRSRAGDNTAQRVAVTNGGGGHPEAAGFTTEEMP